MIGALALWLTYAAAVDVVGDGACPTAADVTRRLTELAPAAPDAAGAAHHRARLSRGDKAVRVELLGAQDEPIAERELPGDASRYDPVDCGKLALCGLGMVCRCYASGCTARDTGTQITFDVAITNDSASGSVAGRLGDHNVHFTKDR